MSTLLTPNPPGGPSASALMAALKSAGATHCVTVPDFVQFALHEQILAPESGIANVFTASEDQALTTATGLHIGGKLPFVMVQNQGFYKCLNTLRATGMDAGVPMVLLVGQFGREPENLGKPMVESRRSMVRLLEPVVDALGLRSFVIEEDADVPRIAEAFAHAHEAETASVVIIARHVTWN
jgi:sulfopyruvate decarboxylase TPP-binding subunit